MGNNMEWLSLVVLGIMLVFMVVSGLIALIRGFKKTLGSTVVIVVSAIIAFILTTVFCRPDAGWITGAVDMLKDLLNSDQLGQLFEESSLANATVYYGVMLISPFVFMALFFVVRFIIGIVMRIVMKLIPLFNHSGALLNRLGGAVLGIVNGFAVVLILLMPFLGTVNVIDAAADEISAMEIAQKQDSASEDDNSGNQPENGAETSFDSIKDFTDPLVNEGAGKFMLSFGGEALYNSVSSARYDGEKITLKNEVTGLLEMVNSVSLLAQDVTTYDDTQIQALDNTAQSLEDSTLLRDISSGLLSDMSDKWLNGESFLGIQKIDAGELFNPIVTEMLEIFSTSDKDNIAKDFRTIADVFEILIENDIFASASDFEALLDKLGGDGVITEIISTIEEDERMIPLANEIKGLSVRALSSVLGIEDTEEYDALMGDIAGIMNNASGLSESEKKEAVKEGLTQSLSDYGVAISGDAADMVTDIIITELGDRDNLDVDDIKDFIASYAIDNSSAFDEAEDLF